MGGYAGAAHNRGRRTKDATIEEEAKTDTRL